MSVCKSVLVLDWTQCLPQGAGASPAMLRGRVTGFPKNWGPGPPERQGKVYTICTIPLDCGTPMLYPCGASSSSCYQTCVFHLSTHFFTISLKLLRSSNEQGSSRRVHCIMCAVFSVARPHSHVASPSKYPYICLCSMLHVNPVRSRFRHLHVVHELSYPRARISPRLTVTLCGVVCNLLSYSLHRMILGENSADFTLRKKQLRDFSLLSAGCCSYREWASLVSCLVFSSLAHAYHLRMSGGAIPASKYRSSILVGFRHPVNSCHSALGKRVRL